MFSLQEGNQKLMERLLEDKPFVAARFGKSELDYYTEFLSKPKLKTLVKAALGLRKSVCFSQDTLDTCSLQTGFYPPTHSALKRFCLLIEEMAPKIDLLGSWLPTERNIDPLLKPNIKVPLRVLEPYYSMSNPWSQALEGKKVLVVHPFAKSIKEQYQKRENLFPNTKILPSFDLQLIKAIQSGSEAKKVHESWFTSLDYMKSQMEKINFEIALIGCGAYGMPLALHAKKLGKKAVHMGGALQLLFGIRGNRWEKHPEISAMFNRHWTRPNENERPEGFQKMEGACYW